MTPPRYTGLARAFHWTMAAMIAAGWCLGYYASTLDPGNEKPRLFATIDAHKTVGVTILFVLVFRLAWRALHAPPAFPATMSPFARAAAHVGHYLLYVLMLLVPVSGVVKSAAEGWGTPVYGLFTIPPVVTKGSATAMLLGGIHDWLVWVFLAVVLGHAAIALKHRFVDRDGIFNRMAVGVRPVRR